MITLKEVTKTFPLSQSNTVSAVRGVSLTVSDNEFLTIVGRSGSGKTTLLNLMAGLTRPSSGQVMIDGQDLWKLNDDALSALRSRCIGFVFQFPSLLPTLTVLENMLLPALFDPNGKTKAAQSTEKRALDLLAQVGLSEKRDVYPRQLSAGQQQRVVIARSLINQPQVLLADEPTSNLDERTELEIMDLFKELHQKMGLTIVMVTHTRQLVSYSTRAVEMAEGRIVSEMTHVYDDR